MANSGKLTAMIRTWEDAEHLAVSHMRILGFEDAAATRTSVDGGVDVLASSGVAQVKHYQSVAIGAPAVQQLRGAAHDCRWALFYTSYGYTRAALTFAQDANVALFTYDEAGTVVAQSARAQELLQGGAPPLKIDGRSGPNRELVAAIERLLQTVIDAAVVVQRDARLAERLHRPGVDWEVVHADEARTAILIQALGGTKKHRVSVVVEQIAELEALVLDTASHLRLPEEVVYAGWHARAKLLH